MTDNDYKICDSCKEARETGKLEQAMRCKNCKGTGIHRTRESFICNQCGSNLHPNNNDNFIDPYGLVDVRVSGGFSSPELTDRVSYIFSLCEKCLRQLFNHFKIPPRVTSIGDFEDYNEELEYYYHRKWVESGGQKEKGLTGLCNHDKDCPNTAVYEVAYLGNGMVERVCEDHVEDASFCLNDSLIKITDSNHNDPPNT